MDVRPDRCDAGAAGSSASTRPGAIYNHLSQEPLRLHLSRRSQRLRGNRGSRSVRRARSSGLDNAVLGPSAANWRRGGQADDRDPARGCVEPASWQRSRRCRLGEVTNASSRAVTSPTRSRPGSADRGARPTSGQRAYVRHWRAVGLSPSHGVRHRSRPRCATAMPDDRAPVRAAAAVPGRDLPRSLLPAYYRCCWSSSSSPLADLFGT